MAHAEFADFNEDPYFPQNELWETLVGRRADLLQDLDYYYSRGKSVQNSFFINDIRAEIDEIDLELLNLGFEPI